MLFSCCLHIIPNNKIKVAEMLCKYSETIIQNNGLDAKTGIFYHVVNMLQRRNSAGTVNGFSYAA